jgi:hypothetical protein
MGLRAHFTNQQASVWKLTFLAFKPRYLRCFMQFPLSWNKNYITVLKKLGIGNYTGPAQSITNTKYFHQIHCNITLTCKSVSLKYSLHNLWLKFCSSFSLGILFEQYDSYYVKYNEVRRKEIGKMEKQYGKSAKNNVVVAIYNLFITDLLKIP